MQKVMVEVHIFSFRQNIYGKEIVIEFIKKIRDEKIFRCQQELIRQIQGDEKQARDFLIGKGSKYAR